MCLAGWDIKFKEKMKIINTKPDMTGWSEERKNTFQCMSVEKKETFEEVLANIYPVEFREKIRKNKKKYTYE